MYKLNAGVRQGGVLSPRLFTVFVNDMLLKLQFCGFGCHISGTSCGCLMYADDLILLSASLTHLQKLVNIAVDELDLIGLHVNAGKSSFMRVGRKPKFPCAKISINGLSIDESSCVSCLGIRLNAGYKLTFNLDISKQKFYSGVNAILARVGNKPDIVLPLCNAQCVSILLYCTEAMNLAKSVKARVAHPYLRLFAKLFHTFNRETLAYCYYYCNCLPLDYIIDLRALKFLTKLSLSKNELLRVVYSLNGEAILSNIKNHYGLFDRPKKSWRQVLWESFCLNNDIL